MAGRRRPRTTAPRQDGFALLIVLWTLVLLAFITSQLVGSGRIETRVASNLIDNAVTDVAADGAVYQAVFNLSDPSPERRWPLDGATRALPIGDCRVTVQLDDEAARINPNVAPPALLESLLRVTGSGQGEAHSLAAAIGEWVGTATAARPVGAMAAEYRAAGLDYAPPGAPLETLGELRRVRGMTPTVYAAIRPHLSLFAPAEPRLAHADPVVVAATAALAQPAPRLGQPTARPLDVLTVRITAVAYGPGNARGVRIAVVQVEPRLQRYTILAWGVGHDDVPSAERQTAAYSLYIGALSPVPPG